MSWGNTRYKDDLLITLYVMAYQILKYFKRVLMKIIDEEEK